MNTKPLDSFTSIAVERSTRSVLIYETLDAYLVKDVIALVCGYAVQQLLITVREKQDAKIPLDDLHVPGVDHPLQDQRTVHAYDPASGRWQLVCDWPPRPSGFCIVTHALLGEELHFFGSHTQWHSPELMVTNSHSVLDLSTGRSRTLKVLSVGENRGEEPSALLAPTDPPLQFSNHAHALLLRCQLYLFDYGSLLCYDAQRLTWSKRAGSSHDWRQSPKVAVCANCLYVIGDDGGNDSVQRYDPLADTWTYCAPLPGGARESMAVAASEDAVYVCGGYEWRTDTWHKACQRYCAETDSWAPIASMNTISYDRTTALWLDGRVVVLDNKYMESYNLATDAWTVTRGMPALSAPASIAVVW